VRLVVWHAVQWVGEIDPAVRAVPDADPAEVSGERTTNVVGSALLGVIGIGPAALAGC
jgi:hypothetical protein